MQRGVNATSKVLFEAMHYNINQRFDDADTQIYVETSDEEEPEPWVHYGAPPTSPEYVAVMHEDAEDLGENFDHQVHGVIEIVD